MIGEFDAHRTVSEDAAAAHTKRLRPTLARESTAAIETLAAAETTRSHALAHALRGARDRLLQAEMAAAATFTQVRIAY
jgi:hypothetical protein